MIPTLQRNKFASLGKSPPWKIQVIPASSNLEWLVEALEGASFKLLFSEGALGGWSGAACSDIKVAAHNGSTMLLCHLATASGSGNKKNLFSRTVPKIDQKIGAGASRKETFFCLGGVLLLSLCFFKLLLAPKLNWGAIQFGQVSPSPAAVLWCKMQICRFWSEMARQNVDRLVVPPQLEGYRWNSLASCSANTVQIHKYTNTNTIGGISVEQPC